MQHLDTDSAVFFKTIRRRKQEDIENAGMVSFIKVSYTYNFFLIKYFVRIFISRSLQDVLLTLLINERWLSMTVHHKVLHFCDMDVNCGEFNYQHFN